MLKPPLIETPAEGASVVITHHVSPAHQPAYEHWLTQIGPLCRASAGLLDWHIIRPIAGYTQTYSVIIRYQNEDYLKQWLDSPQRQALIAQITPLLAQADDYRVSSGLDFLFTSPQQPAAQPPVRWKQFLLTWSAIFPLVSLVSSLLLPLLEQPSLPQSRLLHTFCITGVVVALMVYVVMPRYTRMVRGWLHR